MDGMDPTVITEIAEYFEKEIGYKIPPMTPFVGKNFNMTRAGIHADGMMKDERIYMSSSRELKDQNPRIFLDGAFSNKHVISQKELQK